MNQVEEIARSCGMAPTWEMVDHYASRVAELAFILDQQMGTPCEQIRSAQRIAELEGAIDAYKAEVATCHRNEADRVRYLEVLESIKGGHSKDPQLAAIRALANQ